MRHVRKQLLDRAGSHPEVSLSQLVEIAVRALSPGINDPNALTTDLPPSASSPADNSPAAKSSIPAKDDGFFLLSPSD